MEAKRRKIIEDKIVHLELAVDLEDGIYNVIMAPENLKQEILEPLKTVLQTPEIKKVCDYFENALLSGHHLSYREQMDRNNIKKIILPLLKKSAQWNGENDKILTPIALEFKNTIEKGALQETVKRASTFWKVGGITAVFIGAISAIGIKYMRKKKKNAKR